MISFYCIWRQNVKLEASYLDGGTQRGGAEKTAPLITEALETSLQVTLQTNCS